MKTCGNCGYWQWDRLATLPKTGECLIKLGQQVDIRVKAGWSGGYVDKVETEEGFCCSAWSNIEDHTI